MPDAITLTGLVATTPRHLVTSEGLPITSFRLASTQRRFDRSQEKWIDGETNWYTVTAFRQLALNSNASLEKGQRVLVTGRLKIRDWENGERTGTTIEIEADAVGHDLSWGTAAFTRSVSAATVAPAEPEAPTAEEFPSEASLEAVAPVDDDAVPVPF
jgi:single-strand DNA-binding protein